MKNIFLFLSILFFIFSCKNEPKENVISAEPSAKARTTPHQNGGEQFSLDKGTKVEIIGISSNVDKITIGGKECNEPWYLVNAVNGSSMQGWVYGGCIEFAKNYVKPSFSMINENDLIGKSTGTSPCFEGLDEKGQPECGTDCGNGEISFLSNNEFMSNEYCSGNGTSYYLGKYKIENNRLQLTFNEKYIFEADSEIGTEDDAIANEEDTKGNFEARYLPKNIILEYDIHNFKTKPIFIRKVSKDEDEFIGVPIKVEKNKI